MLFGMKIVNWLKEILKAYKMKTLITISTLILTISIILLSHIFTVATDFSTTKKGEMLNMTCCNNTFAEDYAIPTDETYSLDDEEYINDIPFSTSYISKKEIYNKAIAEEFDFDQESYIDDIPFKTDNLVQNLSNTTE